MSTLLLRIPARAIIDTEGDLTRLTCAYSLRARGDAVERAGNAALADIASLVRDTGKIVLLIAAADVSVLHVTVPPLSANKLRAALPNLIEDRLLDDIAGCVVACSANTGGMRSVAVVQRAWLIALVQTLQRLGARHISAFAETSAISLHDGGVSAVVSEYANGNALAVRLSEHEALGIVQDSQERILSALRTLVAERDVVLIVPTTALQRYQAALAQEPRIKVIEDNSSCWQEPIGAPDLISGLDMQHQAQWHWQPWRWPLLLAASLLLVNTCALNFDWWHANREATNLRNSMKQIYLSTYPGETVILDPLLQMQQKIAAAQRDAGLGAADDFTSLVAEFGAAWERVHPATTITGIEYRAHSLVVQLKSGLAPDTMRIALAERHLSLDADSDLSWRIGSKR